MVDFVNEDSSATNHAVEFEDEDSKPLANPYASEDQLAINREKIAAKQAETLKILEQKSRERGMVPEIKKQIDDALAIGQNQQPVAEIMPHQEAVQTPAGVVATNEPRELVGAGTGSVSPTPQAKIPS